MGVNLFNLAFETKVVVPLELGFLLYRVEAYDEHRSLEDLKMNLDLFEKVRENV